MCFEKIKPTFNEVNRYALEMIKRHEMSLERLNKVGHKFAEWVMTPEEEAQGFSPIAGQGFMNPAAQLGAQFAKGGPSNGQGGDFRPPSNGGFQGPPPGSGGFQGPPPGYGGYGPQGGNPPPFNSNNQQFNTNDYLPIYQPNNFGPNGNVPMNPNFQGMHLPKTALKYAQDFPEQSKVVDDELDKSLEERLKRL